MRRRIGVVVSAAVVALAMPAGPASAPPQADVLTTKVSIGYDGRQANSYAFEPAVSGDGRYVAYFSDASNLVPGDTNGWNDVFVYDTTTGRVERVSVTSSGGQVARGGQLPALSGDGRFVVRFRRAGPGAGRHE